MLYYAIGGGVSRIGAALMDTATIQSLVSLVYAYLILIGFGASTFCMASFSVAQSKVVEDQVPTTVAFIGCAQIICIALSFSIAYSIFLNTATTRTAVLFPRLSVSEIQATIAGTNAGAFQNPDPESKMMFY